MARNRELLRIIVRLRVFEFNSYADGGQSEGQCSRAEARLARAIRQKRLLTLSPRIWTTMSVPATSAADGVMLVEESIWGGYAPSRGLEAASTVVIPASF